MDIDIDLAAARLGSLCSGIVFIIFALIATATESGLFYFLTFAALAVLLFFGWFHRCPSCGRHLGRHTWCIEYCPYCGTCL